MVEVETVLVSAQFWLFKDKVSFIMIIVIIIINFIYARIAPIGFYKPSFRGGRFDKHFFSSLDFKIQDSNYILFLQYFPSDNFDTIKVMTICALFIYSVRQNI